MTISRRTFMLGTATLSAAWVTWGGMPAWGLAPAPAAAPAQFMALSALLVNHRLDAAVGARIGAAAAARHAQCADMVAAILAVARASDARQVEDFFDAIPAGPLKEFAHWVIFAWYTGCSSAEKDAQVFAFEEALTYKTTSDAVAIPSYGFSGPNLWHRPVAPLSALPTF